MNTEKFVKTRNIRTLTKITAVQTEVAPSYNRVRGLYILTVISAATLKTT